MQLFLTIIIHNYLWYIHVQPEFSRQIMASNIKNSSNNSLVYWCQFVDKSIMLGFVIVSCSQDSQGNTWSIPHLGRIHGNVACIQRWIDCQGSLCYLRVNWYFSCRWQFCRCSQGTCRGNIVPSQSGTPKKKHFWSRTHEPLQRVSSWSPFQRANVGRRHLTTVQSWHVRRVQLFCAEWIYTAQEQIWIFRCCIFSNSCKLRSKCCKFRQVVSDWTILWRISEGNEKSFRTYWGQTQECSFVYSDVGSLYIILITHKNKVRFLNELAVFFTQRFFTKETFHASFEAYEYGLCSSPLMSVRVLHRKVKVNKVIKLLNFFIGFCKKLSIDVVVDDSRSQFKHFWDALNKSGADEFVFALFQNCKKQRNVILGELESLVNLIGELLDLFHHLENQFKYLLKTPLMNSLQTTWKSLLFFKPPSYLLQEIGLEEN